LDKSTLQQQQIEVELIAARLFRYRARRGLGVFYSLMAIIFPWAIALYLTVPLPFVILGLIAAYLPIWFVAKLSGFSGLSRMEYSLDFLKGERGMIYDERGYRWTYWGKSLARYFATLLPWFGYSIANQEGYPDVSAIFLLIVVAAFVSLEIFSRSRKKNGILERRVEDWAIIVGSLTIAFVANIPGAPVWTWTLATPLFLICGIKSLYEAPKELALVAF
jgi:hypothetical protein